MDKSKKIISSTSPSRHFAIPKPYSSDIPQRTSLEEANGEEMKENNCNFHRGIGPKSQTPKSGAKNFLSPTISAASKVSLPRKKILGERNEAFGSKFSGTQMGKSPKINKEDGRGMASPNVRDVSSSQITPSSRASESGYDSDSACLPYDPLTNYLSPRPKFLRYKPNRRLEMLLHREREFKNQLLECSCDIKSQKSVEDDIMIGSHASLQDGSEMQEDESNSSESNMDLKPSDNQEIEESDVDDDIDDDYEDEKFSLSYLVLKSLFLLGILFLATFYISSSNCPAVPPCLPSLQYFREGYLKLQEPLSQFTVKSKQGVAKISETIGLFSNTCLMFMESVVAPYPQLEAQGERGISVKTLPVNEEDIFQVKRIGLEEESYEVARPQVPVAEKEMAIETDNDISEAEESGGGLSSLVWEEANEENLMEILKSATDEELGKELIEDETLKALKIVDETCETSNGHGLGTFPTQLALDSFAVENIRGTLEREFVVEVTDEVIGEGTGKEERDGDGMVKVNENAVQACEISEQDEETSLIFESLEVSQTQFMSGSTFPDILSNSTIELKSGKESSSTESIKDEFNFIVAIGFTVILALAASIISGFVCLKRRRVSEDDSSPAFQQLPTELTVTKEHISAFPEEEEILERGDSHTKALHLVHSNNNNEEFYQIQPPTVKLLGEYAVGEISQTEMSSGLKSKTDGGDDEINFYETQEKKRSMKKGLSSSSRSQICTSPSEFSTAESHSYGSFVTTQEKLNKEKSSEGEVMKKVINPVRRSSRIHNRVMSP